MDLRQNAGTSTIGSKLPDPEDTVEAFNPADNQVLQMTEMMRHLAKMLGLREVQAKMAVRRVMAVFVDSLSSGNEIRIPGLGVFKSRAINKGSKRLILDIEFRGKQSHLPPVPPDENPFMDKFRVRLAEKILADRIAARTEALNNRKTFAEPWEEVPDWPKRAEVAAAFAKPGYVVADVGCGAMAVERFLPENCTYLPFDIMKRDERTVVVDLNVDPVLPDFKADLIVCLGVIEYLFNGRDVLQAMLGRAPRMILTYTPRKDESIAMRETRSWVVHSGVREFEAMVEESGWRIVERPVFDEKGRQIMLLLEDPSRL